MTHIDHCTANLMMAISGIYGDVPCGIVYNDCRKAVLDAYDGIRCKYQAYDVMADDDRREVFAAEMNRA